MTTVATQANIFLKGLETRRRNPAKPATLRAYGSYLRTWIVPTLGTLELAAVENGQMRSFVDLLVENKLSPAMICGVTTCLKALVGSETDENGNKLHPRQWNTDFINAPPIVLEAQKAPTVSQKGLNKAISSAIGQFRAFYALQAASGLRMSEMLALRYGPDDGKSSIWDSFTATLYVRLAMFNRVEQSTKTSAGVREVDLYTEINKWLKTEIADREPGDLLFQASDGGPVHVATIYKNIGRDGIPGTHSLRRFRTTYLEGRGVPHALVKYWIGHSAGGNDVTERYTKLGQDIRERKKWAEFAGIGFDLPVKSKEQYAPETPNAKSVREALERAHRTVAETMPEVQEVQ